jgi:hypothetical protein
MVLEQLDTHMQRDKTGLEPMPHTKINSKWNKQPDVRAATVQQLPENTGRTGDITQRKTNCPAWAWLWGPSPAPQNENTQEKIFMTLS